MDISTSVGIALGLSALMIGFILEGGSIISLMHLSAFLIVFGGTIGAVMASFPFSELKKFPQWLKIALNGKDLDLQEDGEKLISFAEKARREGLLSLEQELASVEDKFLYQGMQLVIDGTDPETTREILESNIDVMSHRHHVGMAVFEAAGGFSPTMGIIGTVMGLIQVLGNMEDPSKLSSSIATAFAATLYGVAAANIAYIPIANKLKLKDKQEIAKMEMIMEGVLSIQAGENPSILKEKLKTHLSGASKKTVKGSNDFQTETINAEG